MKYKPEIVKAYFREVGIPEPVFEYQFHPTRKWRLDIAWPDRMIFLEVQGGIFIRGRHSQGAAMLKEWEKLNTLTIYGWKGLFCQPQDLCMAEMAATIKAALHI